MATSAHVLEVTTASFADDVVQQSHRVPVLVDFWATWCGPCRALGPILERLAGEYDGAFVLAKIDTDREQALAAQFQIRSIPTVMLFRDGKQVGGFPGALPEGQIRKFLAQHGVHVHTPQEAWSDDPSVRVGELRAAIAEAPSRGDLQLELAKTLIALGADDEASRVLEALPTDVFGERAAVRLRAKLQLRARVSHAPSIEALMGRVEQSPDDTDAAVWLGVRLALGDAQERAIDLLIDALRTQKYQDASGYSVSAREVLVEVLQWVEDEELVRDGRRRMAGVLF
ncbi:MAG: thioredoxin [Gemmatimonadaceae bacterium]|nr:thioredoxin [Gemmatimonadaceae bacterium]